MSWNDFKNPYNIITLLIGIVGLGTGIYFWWDSKKYKEVSYEIQPSSIIFDKEKMSTHLALYELKTDSYFVKPGAIAKSADSGPETSIVEVPNVPITDNVFIVTGKIWNSGNLQITKDDVHNKEKAISIELPGAKRILDYRITKQYEDASAGFSMRRHNDKIIDFDWEFFDPKYGFSYQIIYIGDKESGLKITGKILDTQFVKYLQDGLTLPMYPIAFLMILIVFIAFRITYLKHKSRDAGALELILSGAMIILMLIVMWSTLTNQSSAPF